MRLPTPIILTFAILVTGSRLRAEDKKAAVEKASTPPPPTPERLASRLWAVTELVLDQHVDPPSRQEMLLGGTKALFRKAGTAVPADLSRQLSDVTSKEQYTSFLKKL